MYYAKITLKNPCPLNFGFTEIQGFIKMGTVYVDTSGQPDNHKPGTNAHAMIPYFCIRNIEYIDHPLIELQNLADSL